jgi:hypothetical protein
VTPKQAVPHERALNKAVELGIASQLDEVERLRVTVQADPFQQVTGEVDAVAIVGVGLAIDQDLRVEPASPSPIKITTAKQKDSAVRAAADRIQPSFQVFCSLA